MSVLLCWKSPSSHRPPSRKPSPSLRRAPWPEQWSEIGLAPSKAIELERRTLRRRFAHPAYPTLLRAVLKIFAVHAGVAWPCPGSGGERLLRWGGSEKCPDGCHLPNAALGHH